MTRTATLVLLMINIPAYIGIGKILFKSWKEFFGGVVQLYRNRKVFFYGWDEMAESWGEMKVFLFFLTCACLFLGEYHLFTVWTQ